jgi:hypothetical protein
MRVSRKSLLILLTVVMYISGEWSQAKSFNVKDFQAKGDGQTLDTSAIQRAIDACSHAGGGTVIIPAGEYLCGTLRLASRVTLQLEPGAVVRQSRRPEDHPRTRHLIVAQEAENVAIVGKGILRGIGDGDLGRRADRSDAQMPEFRAGLALFEKCRNVTVQGITCLLSDTWTLTFRFCEKVTVEDVTIRNHYFHVNSDGIDPVSCKHVRIAGCRISAGDDCIVLKTVEGKSCEDIKVRDCELESIATAIKLGTESSGDFRDIEFADCVVRNSTVGIGIYVKDGGTVERIRFANISLENYTPTGASNVEGAIFPIFMDIEKRHSDSPLGHIRDVTLENITVTSGFGALVQGTPEHPIERLTIRNFTFQVRDPQDWGNRRKHIGGRRTLSGQRDTEFARLPGWLVAAHVRGFTLDGFTLILPPAVKEDPGRQPVILRDAPDSIIRNLIVEGQKNSP